MSVTDEIKAKLDIVDVVSPHVSLQKAGRTFKANCPFHTEKTPSFIVNPERQSWRCFGACATGGDIFTFVMRAENLQFGDALRSLAERAGVELSDAPNRDRTNAIHSVNNAAAAYFQEVLESEAGAGAREYLDSRKVGRAAREQFKLGLSADRWDGLIRYLKTHGYKREDAIGAGLVREGENGRVWDFFRNRLMFPIFDRQGNIVGFGARALDDSPPKYINTAQTEMFDKRNTLYALNFANAEIRQSGTAVIVEGYMDAIARMRTATRTWWRPWERLSLKIRCRNFVHWRKNSSWRSTLTRRGRKRRSEVWNRPGMYSGTRYRAETSPVRAS